METTTGNWNNKGDAKATWRQLSEEKCFVHNSCSCCSCHCCGLCILIIWIIFGAFGAWNSYTVISWVEDGTWITTPCGTTVSSNGVISCCLYDECCVGVEDFFGISATVEIQDISCEDVEPVYTIQMVDNIR